MKGNALSHCLQGTAAATPARAIKEVTASMPDGPNVVALDEGMFTRQLPARFQTTSNYLLDYHFVTVNNNELAVAVAGR